MKRLFLSLSILLVAISLVACSKDKDGGNANPYGYNNQYGQYGGTPTDPNCGNGAYPGMPYQHGGYHNGGYNQGYYPGTMPPNVNCISNNHINGYNPYYFQMNAQFYIGTCDFRFQGRGNLCPVGYYCRPAFGATGICSRY